MSEYQERLAKCGAEFEAAMEALRAAQAVYDEKMQALRDAINDK